MSKRIFGNISNNQSGDRFIACRSTCNVKMAQYNLSNIEDSDSIKDIFDRKPECAKVLSYTRLLKSAINFQETRILNFNSKPESLKIRDENARKKLKSQWPVFPRKSPRIQKIPDMKLDMPEVQISAIYTNFMDWSSNGRLTTIFPDYVYIWQQSLLDTQKINNSKFHSKTALRWNHEGTELAISGDGEFGIWSFSSQKMNFITKCKAHMMCSITAVVWDKYDKFIVTGCNRGIVIKWGFNKSSSVLKFNHLLCAHKPDYRIIALEISPNNRFLCTSGADNKVRIWHWPTLEPHCEVVSTKICRAIAFHPWRDDILAIGSNCSEQSLIILNVTSCKIINSMKSEKISLVDCVTWNPISGELVASFVVKDDNDQYTTKVLVLSAINTIVDTIEGHYGRVLHMMWNPSGTQLATYDATEILYIWDFFGEKPETYLKSIRKSKKDSKSLLKHSDKLIR